jgi:hypothetical protein
MVQIAGTGLTINDLERLLMYGFLAIAIFQILSTYNSGNIFETLTGKILGYPDCTANYGGVKFCFFPSQADIDTSITPTINAITGLSSADGLLSLVNLFSFTTILALYVLMRVFIVFHAFYILVRAKGEMDRSISSARF